MKNKMLIAMLSIIVPVSFAGAQGGGVDFEGRTSSQGGPGIMEAVQTLAPEISVDGVKPVRAYLGYDSVKACETVQLNSDDSGLVQRFVKLSTLFRWRECESAYNCTFKSEYEYAYANVKIAPRELLNGETERIEVCFDFRDSKGSFRILQSPFEYSYTEKTNGNYFLELTPVRRLPKAVASLREFSVSALGSKSGEIGRYSPQWDENGMGFIPCKEQDLTWQSTDTESKIMKREGNDIYVCDFSVTWDFRWTGCRESNPHTSPGWCSCKVRSHKGPPQNTGRCAWESKE